MYKKNETLPIGYVNIAVPLKIATAIEKTPLAHDADVERMARNILAAGSADGWNMQEGTVPEKIIKRINGDLKEVEALILGLITSIECEIYKSYDDDDNLETEFRGSDWFIIDLKTVLPTYGNRIWDKCVDIHDYLDKIKKSPDQESDPANLPNKNPDTV